MSQKTCEQLIGGRLESRIEDIESLFERMNDSDESAYEELNEAVIGVDIKKVVTFTLSWGGPADYFDFVFDAEDDLVEIIYKYQDWFDGARRRLSGNDYDIVEQAWGEIAKCHIQPAS
jgi:hypothetical protein